VIKHSRLAPLSDAIKDKARRRGDQTRVESGGQENEREKVLEKTRKFWPIFAHPFLTPNRSIDGRTQINSLGHHDHLPETENGGKRHRRVAGIE